MTKMKPWHVVVLYSCVFVSGVLSASLDWEEIFFHSFAFVFGVGFGFVIGVAATLFVLGAMGKQR